MSEIRTIDDITLVDFEGIENITKFKYRTTLPKYPKPGTFYWIEQNIEGEPKLGIYFVTNDCELVRLDSKIYDLVVRDKDGYLQITDKDEFDVQHIYLIIGNFEKEDEIIDDGSKNGTRIFKITKEENKGLATVEAVVEYVSDSNNMLYMSNAEDYWWVGVRLGDIRKGKTKEDLKNNTISEILDTIIYPTLQPTHTEPTVTLNPDILDGLGEGDEILKEDHLLISIEKLLNVVEEDESESEENLTGRTQTYDLSSSHTQILDGEHVYLFDLHQTITYNFDKTLTVTVTLDWKDGEPVGMVDGSLLINDVFTPFIINDGVRTCTTVETFEYNDEIVVKTYIPIAVGVVELSSDYTVGSGELIVDESEESESEDGESESITTLEDIVGRFNNYDELLNNVSYDRGSWTYPTNEIDEEHPEPFELYHYAGVARKKLDTDTLRIWIDDVTPVDVETLQRNLDSRYQFGVSLFFGDGMRPRDNKRNLARYDELIDTCDCKNGCEKCYIPPFFAQYIHSNVLTVDVVYPIFMNYFSDDNKTIKGVIRHPLINYHVDGGGVAYVEIPPEVDGFNSDMPCKLCIDVPQHLDVEVYQYNELCHTYDVLVDMDWIYSEVKFNTMYNRLIRTKDKYDTNTESVKYKIVFKKK